MVPNRGDLNCKVAFELVDLIMDNCESRSLLQCSLVCRSWLHRCRPQLFKTVKLNTTSSTLRFASSLGSKYATIPRYIEDLTLQLNKRSTKLVFPDPNGERDPENLRWGEIINLIALRFEHKVPKLRRLSVVFRGARMLSVAGADEMTGETSFISRFASTFEHIIELNLHLPEEEPLALIQFTCSFPNIQVLRIQCGCVDDLEDAENAELVQRRAAEWTLPSSLKSLELSRELSGALDTDGMHHYYQWLNHQRPLCLAQLSIFKVEVLLQSDPDIQPYLTQCRDLRLLHMGFDTWWWAPSDERGE
ncbi:hypothetical protein PQX77_017789 [Marasmius sp. AFHP31]|nr:hypothetical protein PQX77_017789 [Marasmius sp. AFHP31]